MLLLLRKHAVKQLLDATSVLLERVQRLEEEQAELCARLEGERQLRLLMAHIADATRAAPIIGVAIEAFAQSMRTPLPRGRLGGVVRARSAWRYSDGTFMPESEKEAAYLRDYERHAKGGRTRGATAARAPDGTFLPGSSH